MKGIASRELRPLHDYLLGAFPLEQLAWAAKASLGIDLGMALSGMTKWRVLSELLELADQEERLPHLLGELARHRLDDVRLHALLRDLGASIAPAAGRELWPEKGPPGRAPSGPRSNSAAVGTEPDIRMEGEPLPPGSKPAPAMGQAAPGPAGPPAVPLVLGASAAGTLNLLLIMLLALVMSMTVGLAYFTRY